MCYKSELTIKFNQYVRPEVMLNLETVPKGLYRTVT